MNPTLRTFLLNRIADEAHRAASCEDWPECGDGYGCAAHPRPDRVLAECAAKRAIVEQLWAGIADPDPNSDGTFPGIERLWVLRTLATVYAEHPEFREEWRA